MRYYFRLLLSSSLLLLSLNALAATKYFDSTVADGGDGSVGSPFNAFADTTISANDVLMCTGVFPEQITSTSVNGVTMTPYGSGCIIDGENTRDYGILNDRGSNWTINGIEIRNTLKNGIKIFTLTGSTTISSTTLNDTIIHGVGPGIYPAANEAEFEVGTCLLFRTSSSSTAIISGVALNRVKTYSCGKHGVDFRFQVRNIVIDGLETYGNGGTATGHGLSFHPWKETYTGVGAAGWVATSGGVYTMNRKSANDNEQLVIDQTNHFILAQNTSTPTTPALNEWGKDAPGAGGACDNAATTGCLYVRVTDDVDPDTITIGIKRFPHGPILVKNSYAHHNLSGVNSAEGHGFDADDFTGPIIFHSNLAEYNAGAGFQSFYAEQVSFIGNISRLNRYGFYPYNTKTALVINNTADQNTDLGLYDGAVTTTGLIIRNNIFTNNATRGAGVGAGTVADAGFDSGNNSSWDNGANGCNNITCTTTVPVGYVGGRRPTNRAGYQLTSTASQRRAGKDMNMGSLQDCNNRAFLSPPDRGACGTVSGSLAVDRTAAPARSTAPARTTAAERTTR